MRASRLQVEILRVGCVRDTWPSFPPRSMMAVAVNWGSSGLAVRFGRSAQSGAVIDGVAHVWDVAVQTLQGVWQIITGQRGTSGLGGPLKIAQLSGQVAQERAR